MVRRKEAGFTLMELLIVVAIIAVLVAIIIPVFTSRLEKAREATDISNIRNSYAELMINVLDDEFDKEYTVNLVQTKAGWGNADLERTLNNLGTVSGQPEPNGTCKVYYDVANMSAVFEFSGGGGGGGGESDLFPTIDSGDSAVTQALKFAQICKKITVQAIIDGDRQNPGKIIKTMSDGHTFYVVSINDDNNMKPIRSAMEAQEGGAESYANLNVKNFERVYFDESGNLIGYGYYERETTYGPSTFTYMDANNQPIGTYSVNNRVPEASVAYQFYKDNGYITY